MTKGQKHSEQSRAKISTSLLGHVPWNKGNKANGAIRNRHLRNSFKNRPCADCQGWFEPYQMEFDHLRNKDFQISKCGQMSVKKLLEEIAKCEVVCKNCHAIRTHKRSNGGYIYANQ